MLPIVIQITNNEESFPYRSSSKIAGKKEIIFLIQRMQRECRNDIWIATTDTIIDDMYEDIASECNVNILRGNHKDVLERMYGVIKNNNAENLIRVFGNYPLVDIKKMEELEKEHLDGEFEYSYNEHNQGVIWGTGCEIFSKKILEKLSNENLNNSQKEMLSFYIQQNQDKYKINKYSSGRKRGFYKVLLETIKDLSVINDIVNNVKKIDNEHIASYLETHKIIAEYNLESPAKEVGCEKIFLHMEKVRNILRNNEIDQSYPISVELTLTNRCNLHCVYCSDKELRRKQGIAMDMDIDILKKLFDDLSEGGTKGVVLEGGGEPTLYQKFEEVVYHAKRKGLAIGLITNGTQRLNSELLKQFEWIRVSLDASTAEEYQKLKCVDCFEKVIENIQFYCKHCETVGIGYVVTKENISHLEPLVLRLREIGTSYIQLRPVVDCPDLVAEGLELNYLRFYENNKFGVIIDGMKENACGGNKKLPCIAHSITSVISGDGSVYLCGRLNIYDWIKPIGNINEKSFGSIWGGNERLKQAETVKNSDFCIQNCPQCRVTKFNQMFERVKNIKSKHFI